MKRIILTYTIFLAVFTGICNGQNSVVKLSKNYTVNNPEKLLIQDIEKDIDIVLSIPKTLSTEKVYNSSGKIIKRTSYSNSKVDHVATYKYNDTGNRTEWIGESNYFTFKWVYFYNKQGKNYKDIKYHGDRLFQRYEYEFEGDNIKLQRYFDSDGKNFWTNHYTYDSKGRKITYKMTHIIKEQEESANYKYDNCDNLQSQEMYDYKVALKWKDFNVYDKNNNKVETIRYDKNKDIVEKAYLRYNSNNDLIAIKSFDKDNNQVDHVRYIIKYDNEGHKVIEVYVKDDVIRTIDINKIEYYQ
ncbi:hypothetical protein BZG02_13640 [Labilibaculum filiforme]|uniref:Uncharacterized protein n=1 Tax=Labilibaculum filiforme TaxID=1940526 RepID=A0A2N3HVB4_9BACT|nr:hypothetical protein [Labilibaculum filiforme]PKQ61978.1 hypothetical protein BZG02_13640 [Labilibaculum filiforme]